MKRIFVILILVSVCQSAFSQQLAEEFLLIHDNTKPQYLVFGKSVVKMDGKLFLMPEQTVHNYVNFEIKLDKEFVVKSEILIHDNKEFLSFIQGPHDTRQIRHNLRLDNDKVIIERFLLNDPDVFVNSVSVSPNEPIKLDLMYFNDSLKLYVNDYLLFNVKPDQDRTYLDCTFWGGRSGGDVVINSLKFFKLVPTPEQLEQRIMTEAIKTHDYDLYLSKYPDGKYINKIVSSKEEYLFSIIRNGFLRECDDYLSAFPTGKYAERVRSIKSERILYKSASNGGLKEMDAYLTKYPSGVYSSEIESLKKKRLYEIDRQNRIKANSNKALWKTGNKLCYEHNSGTVCGTLNSWNEDKSMLQLKVISGPDVRIEGELIKSDALVWITPTSEWHVCIPEEIESSVIQNEDPYKYWKLGKKICLTGTKGSWIFKTDIKIIAEIIQWNEDKSKVRLRIIDGADGTIYNSESLYNDKLIWDSPRGWKLCN